MRHRYFNGMCENCGASDPETVDHECPAEATTEEVVAMHEGRSPKRCLKITWYQTQIVAGIDPTHLSADEVSELQREHSLLDPSLAGNLVAGLISRLGIPPCGGCEGRRDWMNRAHLLIREVGTKIIVAANRHAIGDRPPPRPHVDQVSGAAKYLPPESTGATSG